MGIYPNPASTEITIDITVEKPTPVNISICDLRGREVGKGINNINLLAGNHRLTMPLSEIRSGTYIIKIQTDTGVYAKLFHHY